MKKSEFHGIFPPHTKDEILQEIIAPDCLFIYHMPFANEDKTGLRGLVRQDMKKYGDSFARIEVLVEQEQTVWVGE